MTPEAEIRRRISAQGPITFAEFMEVALYHPEGGYYTSSERVGAAGDFYTSPSVHPAFGALLAVQLYQMWEFMGRPASFTVVEPGAGSGLLCRDILTASEWLPGGFARSLRYVCIDRRTTGGYEHSLPRVSRIASTALPLRGIVGCILSNELLDALPVHQVTAQQGTLREIFVALNGDQLVTQLGDPSTPILEQQLKDLGVELEEGQVAEVNLAMDRWIKEAALSLDRGFIMTIDYGRLADDLYSATERFRGTLTTYRNHAQTDRPLERIGLQDMSAQVDFTSLIGAGEAAGLSYMGFTTQAAFLQNLGLAEFLQRPGSGPRRQVQTDRVGLHELAKPGGLGDFKVLALGKRAGQRELWGFKSSSEASKLTATLPPPLRAPQHVDLLAGRYPAAEMEFEVSWDDLWPAETPEFNIIADEAKEG